VKFACPKCSTRYSIADEKVPAAKTLRFPCKKCGNVIRLRRKTSGNQQIPSPTGNATRVAPLAELNKLRDETVSPANVAALASEEITAPSEVARRRPAKPAAFSGGETRVAPLAELADLRSEARNKAISEPDSLGFGVTTRIASVKDINQALLAAQDEGPAPATSAAAAVNERPLSIRTPASREPAPREPVPREPVPEWYVLISGKQTGPMSVAQVRAKLAGKEIGERNYVWRDGMTDWKRLSTVDELVAALAPPPLPPLPLPSQPTEPRGPDSLGMEFSDSTVAMDVLQLRRHLVRSRDDPQQRQKLPQQQEQTQPGDDLEELQLEPTDPEDEPTEPLSTKTELMSGKLLSLDTILAPGNDQASVVERSAKRSATFSDPVDLGDTSNVLLKNSVDVMDPAVIDALSGAPTGQRMSRPDYIPNEITGEEELFNRGASASSQVKEFLNATTIPIPALAGTSPLGHLAHPDEEILGPSMDESYMDFPALSEIRDPAIANAMVNPAGYLDAPPGESTRVFMATAGLYRRRRTHRTAAVLGVIFFVTLVGVITLDIMGTLEIPGMGLLYQSTGLVDPNTERGLARVEQALNSEEIDAERRAKLIAMREKLMGKPADGISGGRSNRRANKPGGGEDTATTEVIRDPGEMGKGERDIAADIFGDDRKKENAIRLDDPTKIQAPNLPDGLTEKAIGQVVADNSSSMKLCFNESMRKGEKLAGKMEMEVTIGPDGQVTDVQITSDQFRKTTMGTCTVRRIKNWRFPQYNGEPVTVVLPYHLQSGF